MLRKLGFKGLDSDPDSKILDPLKSNMDIMILKLEYPDLDHDQLDILKNLKYT